MKKNKKDKRKNPNLKLLVDMKSRLKTLKRLSCQVSFQEDSMYQLMISLLCTSAHFNTLLPTLVITETVLVNLKASIHSHCLSCH